MTGDVRKFPPVVYVPTTTGSDGTTRMDMKVRKDSRTALSVYSAIDLLLLDKRQRVEDPLAGAMAGR